MGVVFAVQIDSVAFTGASAVLIYLIHVFIVLFPFRLNLIIYDFFTIALCFYIHFSMFLRLPASVMLTQTIIKYSGTIGLKLIVELYINA